MTDTKSQHAPGTEASGVLLHPVKGKVIAVTSGKGGVGKTFVSANLAAALTRRGLKVLVLDADLGLANLDVVLNLYPKLTLHDVFTGKCALEDAIIKAPGVRREYSTSPEPANNTAKPPGALMIASSSAHLPVNTSCKVSFG